MVVGMSVCTEGLKEKDSENSYLIKHISRFKIQDSRFKIFILTKSRLSLRFSGAEENANVYTIMLKFCHVSADTYYVSMVFLTL